MLKQPLRKLAATLAIGSLSCSLLLSLVAFGHVLAGWAHGSGSARDGQLHLDPGGHAHASTSAGCSIRLAAVMLVMVCFVGLLIFIYSTGYMAHDENFTRFFCFLSLFAGAMLGVVIANSCCCFSCAGNWWDSPPIC